MLAIAVLASTASLHTGGQEAPEPGEMYFSCHSTFECVREAEACIRTPMVGSEATTALGLCSLHCETDNDCPGIGECATLHEGTKLCAMPCGDGCPDDLTCHLGVCKVPLN